MMRVASNNLVRSTYGEMKPTSVSKMCKFINLNNNDTFVDLGSGNGKVAMQAFMESNVKLSIGVEYFPERHYNSQKALKKM